MDLSLKYYRPSAVITLVIIIAAGVGYLNDILQTATGVILSISAVTVVSGFLFAYDRCFWKCVPFLLYVKDISGRYSGELFSDYNKSPSSTPYTITIEIKQTASYVHITQFTQDKSGEGTRSTSVTEEIRMQGDGCVRLSFSYLNEGVFSQKEKFLHQGFCIVDFDSERKKLEGRYFTNRDPATKGKFHADFKSKKLLGRI